MKRILAVPTEIVRGFLRHDCALKAAGLTYFSLVTVLPVLCLLLLLARTLGAGEFARRELNSRLDELVAQFERPPAADAAATPPADAAATPAADAAATPPADAENRRAVVEDFAAQARQVANEVFDRVEKFDVSTVGWVGLGLLLWSVVSTLGMVEASFNRIWGVRRDRPVWQKLLLYALASLVLPLLAAAALSLPVMGVVKNVITVTAGVAAPTKILGDFLVALLDSRAVRGFVTLFFFSAAFALLYKFMPRARVGWRFAAESGVFTAVVFCGWMKLCVVAQMGIANASALYGSLAFLPIVLAWLYMSWQIVLLGACTTHAIQVVHNGRRLRGAGG